MDGRKNNGGHKTNGGRKSKAEEQKLIERLSPLVPKAFKALEKSINEGESWAVKLLFEYSYGKPHQSIALDAKVDIINYDYSKLSKQSLIEIANLSNTSES